METISNLAGVAQKVIFGTGVTGEEPVAGVQGGGTAESPFDKGNEEAENENKPSDAAPSEITGDPSSAQQGLLGGEKNQGANDPNQEPSSAEIGEKDEDGNIRMPHSDAEREKLMEKGEFPRDPNDHSGEPLKVHNEAVSSDDKDDEDQPKDRKDSVAQEGGDPHGEEKKGDGTEYVKSSGVAADGGDFDATKPGAGAEANRLLETKGVHKDGGGAADHSADTSNQDKSSGDSAPAVKESKLQKIKDKLHIH